MVFQSGVEAVADRVFVETASKSPAKPEMACSSGKVMRHVHVPP